PPLVFSIFAFATCGGYSGSLELSIECPPPNRSTPDITVTFGYPFRLHRCYLLPPPCAVPPSRVFLVGDFSSSAQFFVAVAVGAFVSAGAALGAYVGAARACAAGGRGPRLDLGVTVALAFLWLVASCAWAAALAGVKAATDPAQVLAQVSACRRSDVTCRPLAAPRMSGLNTSVVFGFLNLVLWTGNIWFVFKETGWGGLGARPPPQGVPEKAPAPEGGLGQPEGGFGQPTGGYGQPGGGAPTSFANQM
uniref:MARVEL domain-containing protein n=1 Tax=Melopsittacus undulatus TaxID=13146 RepID=A0A8V5GQ56_MELUD